MSAGLTEGEFEFRDIGVYGFGDLGESDAEESDDDGEDFVAGGDGVEDADVSMAPVPEEVMK